MGETAEGQGVMDVGEEDKPDKKQDTTNAGDTDEFQMVLKSAECDAEQAEDDKDESSAGGDVKEAETTEEKDKQCEEKGEKEGQVEERQCCEKEGEKEKLKDKEDGKCEMAKNDDVKTKEAEGTEKKISAKQDHAETTDKGKLKEPEKQLKPKRKSGPSSSSSRPRPSVRSIRASAKNDIIAKFQQGAPE